MSVNNFRDVYYENLGIVITELPLKKMQTIFNRRSP